MTQQVKIFDTTLRDGEQSPGYAMTTNEKVIMAQQLERLGVDIIEAGFPIASYYDHDSVKAVADNVKGTCIAALARAVKSDIESAASALKNAVQPRIHTFIATSPVHMAEKICMTPEQVLERIHESVTYARNFTDDVQWSGEDFTNTNREFMLRSVDTAIKAGASTINMPDTVGFMDADEHADMFLYVMNNVPDVDTVTLSAHCHNDRGQAVANSMAAIRAGVGQVECTINGIGERAGNAALEEIVMGMHSRPHRYPQKTNIKTQHIIETARCLEKITGIGVQPNKAITGKNAFTHASGIHQHGQTKNDGMYEIIRPQSVGTTSKSVIQRHSGKAAIEQVLRGAGVPQMTDEIMVHVQTDVLEFCIQHKIAQPSDVVQIAKRCLVMG
jgi:2-isopropylmalate synthase